MKKATLLLTAVTVFMSVGCGAGETRGPNVLVILIDTIRADHLGCMGYRRNTTPTLDSLAREGVLYSNCQSHSSWTLPAMAGILSGLNPREHAAGRHYDALFGVPEDIPWMPMIFKSAGYRTAAFFNVIFMNADFGFHRGFDFFDCSALGPETRSRNAGETVEAVLSWFSGYSGDKPFFVAVHFFDPHLPYSPPAPWDTLFADPEYSGEYGPEWGGVSQLNAVHSGMDTIPPDGLEHLVALYDGEIAYADGELGRLLETLRERGLMENTVVVVVGDHGEEFMEHGGMDHGRTLYQEICHVPLIFSGPGVPRGLVVETLTGQVGVMPEVLRLAGLEGGAVTPLYSGELEPVPVPASDVLWREGNLASLVVPGAKLIWGVDEGFTEAYNLLADPAELEPLPPDSAMMAELEWYWGTPPLAESPLVNVQESIHRELRALGYIR